MPGGSERRQSSTPEFASQKTGTWERVLIGVGALASVSALALVCVAVNLGGCVETATAGDRRRRQWTSPRR